MAVAPVPYLKAYCFLLLFGRHDVAEAKLRLAGVGIAREEPPLRLTGCWSNPFAERPEVWLSAGISTAGDATMLGERVAREEREALAERRPPSAVAVFLQRDGSLGRMLSLRFERHRWAPLQLDASSEKNAEEWVILEGVEYLP